MFSPKRVLAPIVIIAIVCSCTVSEKAPTPVVTVDPRDSLGRENVVEVSLQVDQTHGSKVPDDFLGLSYEKTALMDDKCFDPSNGVMVNLFKGLGTGVLRIGADQVDRTYWRNGNRTSTTSLDSVTTTDLDRLSSFIHLTGWSTIYAVNLAVNRPDMALSEAKYVSGKLGGSLLCFEIGNEPDSYALNGIRTSKYTYGDYEAEFERYFQSLKSSSTDVSFCGPSIGSYYNVAWVQSFARYASKKVKFLSGHFYPLGPASDPNIDVRMLLAKSTSFADYIRDMKQIAAGVGLPYRIDESNSVYGGGKRNVSNTLASALWSLDMMHFLALNDGAGINFHGGDKPIGTPIIYTPIVKNGGRVYPQPMYYSMVLFGEGSRNGRPVPVVSSVNTLNSSTYAYLNDKNLPLITLINKESDKDIVFAIAPNKAVTSFTVQRLTGKSLLDVESVSINGKTVDASGIYQPDRGKAYKMINGKIWVKVSAGSAVLISGS